MDSGVHALHLTNLRDCYPKRKILLKKMMFYDWRELIKLAHVSALSCAALFPFAAFPLFYPLSL